MTEPSVGRGVDLSSAFDSTMGVLRKVEPQDLARPTPCASWDVRALINHIISAARWWAAMVSGDPGLEAAEGADFVGGERDGAGARAGARAGDFVAAYEESIRVTLDAFGAPGAAERMVTVPFGEFPGTALAQFAATDQFTHGWDLARALGQDTDLVPELAVALLGLAEVSITDALRGPDTEASFGPERAAPDGACAADRLAAYLGREV
ncbi:uncharacterized protein (TIGR03086 family) [Catenulispora sp. EB89]|uniref:TIGR03086 family metal-binding protein n=1 Tax=Catenulispora sp. EB89 TaxID=3156257 RepID=UPI003515EC03